MKSAYTDISYLIPRKSGDNIVNEKDFIDEGSFNKKFKRKASISYDALPNNSIKKEDVPTVCQNIIAFYDIALNKLDELYNQLPDSEVEDYNELWKNINN
mgnify:CR=1 FL=1